MAKIGAGIKLALVAMALCLAFASAARVEPTERTAESTEGVAETQGRSLLGSGADRIRDKYRSQYGQYNYAVCDKGCNYGGGNYKTVYDSGFTIAIFINGGGYCQYSGNSDTSYYGCYRNSGSYYYFSGKSGGGCPSGYSGK